MKSKRVDLEINEASDIHNKSNINLITIATVKIQNNNGQIE